MKKTITIVVALEATLTNTLYNENRNYLTVVSTENQLFALRLIICFIKCFVEIDNN